jgi:chromosome condensin MukBEF MukE localization factor
MSNVVKVRSPSTRLRRIGRVYEQYMRNNNRKEKVKSSLNKYQEFVKKESQREKYKNMKGGERMYVISKAWEEEKRRDKMTEIRKHRGKK